MLMRGLTRFCGGVVMAAELMLSQHFSLPELTATKVRAFNQPNAECLANLVRLASVLERVREVLGDKPVIINSAYRSPGVNAAVGGVKNSSHLMGLAADFVCPDFGSPLEVCEAVRGSGVALDQLINVRDSFVHLGIANPMRGQLLTIDKHGTRVGLHKSRG